MAGNICSCPQPLRLAVVVALYLRHLKQPPR
jgi:hypothetical protein